MKKQTQNNLTHGSIARQYKFVIMGTLALLIIENVITVAVPYLMGMAIDGLIAKSNAELYLFFVVVMGGLIVGIARRLYDTRVYGRIYQESASELIEKEIGKNAGVSKMTARATFVSDFTNFLNKICPLHSWPCSCCLGQWLCWLLFLRCSALARLAWHLSSG